MKPSEKCFKSFLHSTYNDQIKPIPMTRQKIECHTNPKLIQKISLKGHKYISRVAASGEHTFEVLNQITKTSTIKVIQSLEFDPYFCSESGLRQLSEVLKKLKRNIFRLHMVIRRFKTQEEIGKFYLFFVRLSNLMELHTEILKTQSLDHKRLHRVMKSYTKLSKLKSLRIKVVGFQSDSSKDFQGFRSLFHKVPKLEKLSYHIQSQKVFVNRADNAKFLRLNNDLHRIKSFSLKFSFKTGWIPSFGTEFDSTNAPTLWKILPQIMNPIHFSLSFNKFPLPSVIISDMAGMFSQMTKLRFIHLEITRTRLREYELLIFAQGFLKCQNLEHLTFKYLDNEPLPLPDLIQFITIMATYSTFPKLDLYFRKIFPTEWESRETVNTLQKLKNTEYVLTKQSIHVYKALPLSND